MPVKSFPPDLKTIGIRQMKCLTGFASNTKGVTYLVKAVATYMMEKVPGISLMGAPTTLSPLRLSRHHGHGNMDLYNASKWALNGFTFDWASLTKHIIRK